jgi:pimeloyl-ACP methyl ester carboxylesterase
VSNNAPISHRFAAPSGVSLAVHDWRGTGDPVLLAHPTGFHGRAWAPVAARLVDAGRKVWSFDFRGHGDSDPRIWCFEPIVIPSASPVLAESDNPLSAGARRRRDQWPSKAEALASYSSKPPLDTLTPEALRAYVDYGLRERPDGTVELKCRPEHEATIYMMGASLGLFPDLGKVDVPVLVASGETTTSITPELAQTIVDQLPRGTLEVWADRGHFGPLDDPDRAVTSMLRFAASTASNAPRTG